MAAIWEMVFICLVFITSCAVVRISGDSAAVETKVEASPHEKPCTYFGGARMSSAEGNLVNCSWYASNSCCKRTEVTSVFGGMFPLYGASKECTNMINYMMCYFCSPEQYRWYDKAVYVCADYCRQVYENCMTAEYKGKSIGAAYASGEDFCRGQKFIVVEGNGECFDFNPFVFGSGNIVLPSFFRTLSAVTFAIIIFIHS